MNIQFAEDSVPKFHEDLVAVGTIQPQLTVLDGKIICVHMSFAEEYNLKPAGALISTCDDLKGRRAGKRGFPESGASGG